MDRDIIERTARWLLNARKNGEKGWGQTYQGGRPSVTVTSEVVTALAGTLPHLSTNKELHSETKKAIDAGLAYITETLPSHKDPDLTNYASALIAFVKSNAPTHSNFLQNECIPKLLEFGNDGQWEVSQGQGVSAFAAYLGMKALGVLKSYPQVFNTLASDMREQINKLYEGCFRNLRSTVFLDDGTVKEVESVSPNRQEPALNSLWLNFRVCDLIAHNINFQNDRVIQPFIKENLLNQELSIKEKWTYQLPHTTYKLCFLPYLVEALTLYIERRSNVDTEILDFYYRLALFMTSEEVQTKNTKIKPNFWWGMEKNDKNPPMVWVGAHFLIGLVAIPISIKELNTISRLQQQNCNMATEVSKYRVENDLLKTETTTPNKYIGLGNPSNGRPWIRVGLGTFTLLLSLTILFNLILLFFAASQNKITGIALTGIFISLIILVILLFRRYEDFNKALTIANLIVGFLGLIGIVPTVMEWKKSFFSEQNSATLTSVIPQTRTDEKEKRPLGGQTDK